MREAEMDVPLCKT